MYEIIFNYYKSNYEKHFLYLYRNKIAFLTLAIKNNPLDLSKKSE